MSRNQVLLSIMIILFLLCSLLHFAFSAEVEVIGQNTYKNCLYECMESNNVSSYDDSYKNTRCSECFDNCLNQLRRIDPDNSEKIREKMDKELSGKNDCFINSL